MGTRRSRRNRRSTICQEASPTTTTQYWNTPNPTQNTRLQPQIETTNKPPLSEKPQGISVIPGNSRLISRVVPLTREFPGKFPTSPDFTYKEAGKSLEIQSTNSRLLILYMDKHRAETERNPPNPSKSKRTRGVDRPRQEQSQHWPLPAQSSSHASSPSAPASSSSEHQQS